MADLDLENLAPTIDIDTFDPKGQDRGDSVINADPEPVIEKAPVVDKTPVEDPVEDPVVEDPVEDPVVEEPARDDKGKFASKGIPKARFDEAVGKEREAREAAERRAAELERQLKAQEKAQVRSTTLDELETKIAGMEKKADELLLDGNVEEASKLRREIRMTERQIAKVETEETASQRTSQILEGERFDAAVARLEADHPTLNPTSETYDKRAVSFVLSEQRRLMTEEGLSPSAALVAAAKDVMAMLTPKEAPAIKEGLSAADKAAEDRKAAQVKKNLDTLTKQPASMKDSGIDSDKAGQTGVLPDVKNMSQEEFNALPKATIAKLRGDLL